MIQRRGPRGQGSITKRGKWWHVFYSINGRKFRESARTMIREEALTYLRRKLGKVANGETIAPERLKIADLLQLVSNDYELKERASSYIAELKIAKYLRPAFGETRVMKFRSAQVEAFIKQRQNQKAAAATINRELALLRRAFQLGYRADPPMVPRVPHIPELPENNVRTGFLQQSGYRKLLAALPLELQLLLVFGYHLGMRKSALLQLKWKQVDFKTGLIYLERKKSAKNIPQAVPIYGDMRAFLEKQPRDSVYLFARGSEQIKDFRAAWKTTCKTAGLSGLLFHDLRRSAARNLRRAGVPEMKITGHKTRAMYERYDIVDEEDIREVGRKAEQFHSKEEQSSKKVHKARNPRKEGFS
jgi:integrase